jgi:hypothetical protein
MLEVSIFIVLAGIKLCRLVAKRIRPIRLNVLGTIPDGAQCKITGKPLVKMHRCPILNFDDDGILCVPSMCEEYEEE